jgi:putative ABC transport system permease protein
MQTLLQDLRYAFRVLRKSPGFSVIAIGTLALGIGANTAIFSVVYGILLRPLPYTHPERLVSLTESYKGETDERTVAYNELQFLRARTAEVEAVAAYTTVGFNFAMGREPQRVNGLPVTANYFQVLGVSPVAGRLFSPEEDSGNGARVVLLAYGLWKQAGSDPAILGRTVTLDGEPFTVIGVMPPNFERIVTPLSHGATDLWIPLALVTKTVGVGQNLAVIGRLKDGVTLAQARAQMVAVSEDFEREFWQGHTSTEWHLDLETYQAHLSSDLRTILLVLFGAVGFVLLIACANVANLLLGRASARTREIAVRTALGASQSRLFRQLLTESVLLSVIGAIVGAIIARWGLQGLIGLSPRDIARIPDVHLDATALGFTLLAALATGVGFGLLPAFKASKTDVNDALKESGRISAGRSSGRVRTMLAIGEIALSLVLLTGSALLIETFWNVLRADPGFNPSHLLSVPVWLTGSKYESTAAQANFYDQVLGRIRSLPGVESAAVIAAGHPLERSGNMGVRISGKETPDAYGFRMVTAGYFKTLGVPLELGRPFATTDNGQSMPVAIVSESFARRIFAGESPVGQHLIVGGAGADKVMPATREIVGVVGDVKSFLDEPAEPTVYIPIAQAPYSVLNIFSGWFATSILVRTSNDPLALSRAVIAQIHGVDSSIPAGHIRTMDQVRSAAVAMREFNMVLLSLFAGLALLLAAVGIFGVMAHNVTQRSYEIGVRLALGAQRRDVLRLILGEAVRLVAIGVGAGVAGALVLTRLIESYLYEVRPTDPAAFIGTAAFLGAVALLACYIPVRRALRVDPMIALRYE